MNGEVRPSSPERSAATAARSSPEAEEPGPDDAGPESDDEPEYDSGYEAESGLDDDVTAWRAPPPAPAASGVAFAEGTNQSAHSTAPAAVAVTIERRWAEMPDRPAAGTEQAPSKRCGATGAP